MHAGIAGDFSVAFGKRFFQLHQRNSFLKVFLFYGLQLCLGLVQLGNKSSNLIGELPSQISENKN
jgi:hypothetical protein